MNDGYQVARFDDTAYIRVIGLANMKNAPVLDAFLRQECADGLRCACIDLSVCKGMDSTFMGTLVGHHMRMSECEQAGELVVVNPSEGNHRLLKMLGVSEVISVVSETIPDEAQWVMLEAKQGISPVERAEMMKAAHEHLVRINDANKAKFNPFLEALGRDLRRLRQPTQELESDGRPAVDVDQEPS